MASNATMGAKPLTRPASQLYDEDFVVWAIETARLLRERRFEQIDIEHLAEEVEAMGRSQKHEVRSRLRVLLVHLLKWKHQPRRRSAGWQSTMTTQRTELRDLFEQSPSLRRQVSEALPRVYLDAAKLAAIETGLAADAFPRACPFSPAQILDDTFLPER